MRIGIDIGNVIIGGPQGSDTQFFTDDYLATPEVEGAWDTIRYLKLEDHELHIVSKCGKIVEAKSLEWLDKNGFHKFIPLHRTHFVRQRHLKVFMAQALELKVFVDDMEDVIESMQGVVQYPILFTSWEQTNAELEKILQLTRKK